MICFQASLQGRLTAQDVGPSQSRSDNILVHSETLSQRVGQLAVSTGTTFVLPQVLRIILKVVVSCEDPVLRLETLQYILCLLEANPFNSEALTLVCTQSRPNIVGNLKFL